MKLSRTLFYRIAKKEAEGRLVAFSDEQIADSRSENLNLVPGYINLRRNIVLGYDFDSDVDNSSKRNDYAQMIARKIGKIQRRTNDRPLP